jgi:hypothetical protein
MSIIVLAPQMLGLQSILLQLGQLVILKLVGRINPAMPFHPWAKATGVFRVFFIITEPTSPE